MAVIKDLGTFDIGDNVRIEAEFYDMGGLPADPTNITLRVKDPSGTVTVYTYADDDLARGSRGTFWLDLVVATAGTWFTRWEAAGGLVATEEGKFTVNQSAVL